MKRKSALMVVGTLVLAAAGTLGMSGTAQAADPDRRCYDGEFCVYRDTNWSQAAAMYRFTGADNWWWWGQPRIKNDDSSWYNKWSVAVRVYDENDYTDGVTICVPSRNGYVSNRSANDRGESHKYNGTNSC